MSDKNNEVFLTVHGHFYQPPRENPWLESIELQDSALPSHDWNERVNKECYNPNSVSKIVDSRNRILDVVNNYEYMSFNFGPTLLSWMEHFAPLTYERIIKADIESIAEHNGHGNAMAQVYNHIIMPLANENDKITQIKWGIRDFEYRFGRKPEGMWLAETAVDDDTLRLLVENGVKFTVLSPYQAEKFKEADGEWQDVSWGNIDPARSYRYYIKSAPGKFIDLFFYDGAISRSVAFDELLKDGNKFAKRLKDGVSDCRNFPQLINIATDGESYGHHTKFGDMALAYVLKIKAKDEGFTITNYAEYLDKYRSNCEVEIKQASSWSCFHGVGRWKEDCGCSTGGHPGWNQKWRKPLRNALDYLRDEMAVIFEAEGQKYFNDDVWNIRNKYIDVILDRNEMNVKKFQQENFKSDLSDDDKVKAMELLEIQRQALLMYTSCGWFFAEISGLEPVQLMKYAARAMQLSAKFTDKNLEENFLNILSEAKSNIPEHGTGKDIFERFVKPSVVTPKQIASLWALSSLYQDFEDEENVYCYTVKKHSYKKVQKGSSAFVVGHIEIQSRITLQKSNLMFALIQFSGGDFHCTIKEYSDDSEFNKIKNDLIKTFLMNPLTEIIRALDEYFGKEYFTLKDIFIEERRKILQILLKGKLEKFSQIYRDMYDEGKGSIYHLQGLGLKIPDEFKLSAGYALSHKFNDIIIHSGGFLEDELIQQACDINFEARRIDIQLDKSQSNNLYGKKILQNINRLVYSFEPQQADVILELFHTVERLELHIDIAEAQNVYFAKIYHRIGDILEAGVKRNRHFIEMLLDIGDKLNINTEFYRKKLDKALLSK